MHKGESMETYVILMEMTQKGMDEIHKIPATVDELEEKFAKKNVKLKGFYKVMGETDYVAIVESKDDIDGLAAVAAFGKTGYFDTLTLKAYTMDEMKKAVGIYAENFK